jgi:CheY-like chemotaxis protein
MPEMSGIEATVAIRLAERGTGRHLPIIALTAHAMKSDREACLSAGMDGYVTKPVRAAELFAAIARVTRGASPPAAGPSAPEAPFAPEAPSALEALANIIDREAAMEGVDGDVDLLCHLGETFLQVTPRMLSEMNRAIAAGDRASLYATAHRLKGSTSIFRAQRAMDAAARLEGMGREGDMAGAEGALDELRESMRILSAGLAALIRDTRARRDVEVAALPRAAAA